jgi:hypothetical protein
MRAHQIPDLAGRGIGYDSLEAPPDFDADVAGVGITLAAGHQQEDQPGISPRISDLRVSADSPLPSDRESHLGRIVVADRGQGHDRDLSAGDSAQPLDQVCHASSRRGIDGGGQIVDVPGRLRRDQRVDTGTLREYECGQSRGVELKHHQ